MEGAILVSYKVLKKNDFLKEITLEELLKNDKVVKAIKSEFAKGIRNVTLKEKKDCSITIETTKTIHQFEARKSDFADLVSLAEDHATQNKHMQKDSIGIEIVDFEIIK